MVRTKRRKRKATKGKQTRNAPKNTSVVVLAERTLNGEERSLHDWMGPSNEERVGEPTETNRNECSLAMAWSAEPEWQGESSEAVSETGGGSREPECVAA